MACYLCVPCTLIKLCKKNGSGYCILRGNIWHRVYLSRSRFIEVHYHGDNLTQKCCCTACHQPRCEMPSESVASINVSLFNLHKQVPVDCLG